MGPIYFCLMARPRYRVHPWKPAGSCACKTVLRQQPQRSYPSPQPYAPKDPPVVRVMEGPLFSEVASYYQHVQTVVRLYNVPGEILRLCQLLLAQGTGQCCPWGSAPHCLLTGVEGLSLDVSCLVDIRDHINKELALRFSTDIESDDTFFTDLNGFQVCSSLGRDSSCPQGDSALAPGTVGATSGH